MRIDPINFNGVTESKSAGSRNIEKSPAKAEIPKDRLELSSAGQDPVGSLKLRAAEELERGTSPERLRELKEQIREGSYFVSSEAIAEKML